MSTLLTNNPHVTRLSSPPTPPTYYVDPQNVSGNASDTNTGLTALGPLLKFSTALKKQLTTEIRVIVMSTVQPTAGSFIFSTGTAIAKDCVRSPDAWAVVESIDDDPWEIASNWALTGRSKALLVNCQYIDMRGVSMVGSSFDLALPTSVSPCEHIRMSDWTVVADPANQADSTKGYGISGINVHSVNDIVVDGMDISGGNWPVGTGFPGGLNINGTASLPVTDGSFDIYMHDWVDGHAMNINGWQGVSVNLRARNSGRINGTLHMDTIQAGGAGIGGDDLQLSLDVDNCFGSHIRTTDITSTRVATNMVLTDIVAHSAPVGGEQAFALSHTPGLVIKDSVLVGGLYLQLHSGTVQGPPGADISNCVVDFYANSSTKQINSVDTFTRANTGVVQTGGGFLAYP